VPETQTKYFGPISYEPDSVIECPAGLPGFEQERRFIIIEQAINKPLIFFQSLSRPDLCFVTLPLASVAPDYQLRLSGEDLQTLGLPPEWRQEAQAEILALVVISLAEGRPPTANLLSPIVIHWASRRAVQSIQIDCQYSHQEPLPVARRAPACS